MSEKCQVCRKKLVMNAFQCKCSKIFCLTHLFPHEHQCTFDFKSANKDRLTLFNPKIISSKMIDTI